MPTFRAINQPTESPPKPTAGARQLPDTVSRPKCEVQQARPLVLVPLRDKLSQDQQRNSDLRQAIAEAKKALEKPRKKKRSSALSTSKPRRQQAAREKKLVYSIEYSPLKPTGTSTPECSNDRDDSDFVPSKADLAEISMSSAPNTPSRRSPRKHPSKYWNIGLSPQASSGHAATMPESSPPMAPGITARPLSPSLSSSRLRRKLYKRDDFVEIPKDVFERFERKKRRREKRVKKDAKMAEKRKEKGKAAEHRLIEETYKSRQKSDKRKAEDQTEHDELPKRPKLEKSRKPRPADLVYDGKDPSDVLQTSKQRGAQWSSKDKTTEERVQRYEPVPVKAEDRSGIIDLHSKTGIEGRSEGSKKEKVQPKAQHIPLHDDQSGDQAPRDSGRKGESSRPCLCSKLPDYFTRNPRYVPRLETWPGDASQFFEHVKQISNCPGSIHPRYVVNACYWIIKGSEVAQGVSSASGRHEVNPGRAQSSIPPPVFYGKNSGRQPDPSTGSQNSNTECSTSKTLPLRPQSKTAEIHGAPSSGQSSKHITPSTSSSLGLRQGNDAPSGQENVGARQISKFLPEASSVLARPETTFDARRQRHQSAPVNALGRNGRVDERIHSGASAPQRHNNALLEVSNNAMIRRMEQRMDEFQKVILERIPATAPTQVAAAGPVSAQAPGRATAAQDGNGVDPPPASSERQRPSYAEQLLKRPRLDRHVPAHLRLTDERIIEIGRIVAPYERHVEGPQAFDHRGRLFAEYKHLLSRTVDGGLVWTPDEIRRLTR